MPTQVSLRPSHPSDRRDVFTWLVAAYDGPFFCTEEAPPTWDEFCVDYSEIFFDGSAPHAGRVFIIEENERSIGAVSFDARFREPDEADIDIWLASEQLCGRGRGVKALQLLAAQMKGSLGFKRLLICPCVHNTRAVRAYIKAGFRQIRPDPAGADRRYGPFDCSHAIVMLHAL